MVGIGLVVLLLGLGGVALGLGLLQDEKGEECLFVELLEADVAGQGDY